MGAVPPAHHRGVRPAQTAWNSVGVVSGRSWVSGRRPAKASSAVVSSRRPATRTSGRSARVERTGPKSASARRVVAAGRGPGRWSGRGTATPVRTSGSGPWSTVSGGCGVGTTTNRRDGTAASSAAGVPGSAAVTGPPRG
jgi:hypothetical protein